MPITAQSADGVNHEFPDGTDRAVIDRVMKQYAVGKTPVKFADIPGPAPKESPASGLWQRLVEPVAKAAGGMASSLWENLLAGEQGVKTHAEGATLAPQAEQWKFAETQQVSDPRKFFAQRDPQSGKMAVYQRGAATEAGAGERLSQLGHVAAVAQPERFPGPTP